MSLGESGSVAEVVGTDARGLPWGKLEGRAWYQMEEAAVLGVGGSQSRVYLFISILTVCATCVGDSSGFSVSLCSGGSSKAESGLSSLCPPQPSAQNSDPVKAEYINVCDSEAASGGQAAACKSHEGRSSCCSVGVMPGP